MTTPDLLNPTAERQPERRDIHGRPYARLDELKPGHLVEVDGGFTCLRRGEICEARPIDRARQGVLM